ncbi:OLC1v1011028C1 [Oldenlandia corymbosa var. corymbosa]|uniref:OLC1v1011028C1 n=1 Tax=Oldenlandia corymbosa var. corymbosa TaxID=529605 RepID=A0AAV1DVH6_OLDCO|nr:OLC1v1011028C1 [Oldenlandia corymbosa var. corymbosa]
MANHHRHHQPGILKDPFLLKYNAADLRIASTFLSDWLPFLSRGLCRRCTGILSDRIGSLDSGDADNAEPLKQEGGVFVPTLGSSETNECDESQHNCDSHSLGSWKDEADVNDIADTNSLGSWKDGENGPMDHITEIEYEASASETSSSFPAPLEVPSVKMSWADMAQEDELDMEEEDNEVTSRQVVGENGIAEEGLAVEEAKPRTQLPRDQREYIRFTNVQRKKDFICLEKIKGKIVNILEGLELHTGIFSAAEQKRIVDYVESLQEMGRKGELKGRSFTAPQKWMRGKGRVTIQFGCCYNYATDKNGNPPGILKREVVEPIPNLFKVMIKRLVRWHVLPPSCVPDSCIVNVYDVGDCIPPHIDNHDFVRPFCTVSFLSECDIIFGTELKVVGPGEFSGSFAIPLPVGSVLVLNGNGADVAKHSVPAVPSKRISITFRKMDESKWPIGYVPEPDLQGLQPLPYEVDSSKKIDSPKYRGPGRRQFNRREDREHNSTEMRGSTHRGSEQRHSYRGKRDDREGNITEGKGSPRGSEQHHSYRGKREDKEGNSSEVKGSTPRGSEQRHSNRGRGPMDKWRVRSYLEN